jgi:hypothetical protein
LSDELPAVTDLITYESLLEEVDGQKFSQAAFLKFLYDGTFPEIGKEDLKEVLSRICEIPSVNDAVEKYLKETTRPVSNRGAYWAWKLRVHMPTDKGELANELTHILDLGYDMRDRSDRLAIEKAAGRLFDCEPGQVCAEANTLFERLVNALGRWKQVFVNFLPGMFRYAIVGKAIAGEISDETIALLKRYMINIRGEQETAEIEAEARGLVQG